MEELDVNRRYFVVLLISGILLVAVIPLNNTLSNPSGDVDSSSDYIPTMHILQDVEENRDEIGKLGSNFVLGEVIIKFRREAAEGEIFWFYFN